jgi:hypothetical protein
MIRKAGRAVLLAKASVRSFFPEAHLTFRQLRLTLSENLAEQLTE